MADRNTRDFDVRLEALERMLADQAADPSVAAIHTQLADGYARMIEPPLQPIKRVMI